MNLFTLLQTSSNKVVCFIKGVSKAVLYSGDNKKSFSLILAVGKKHKINIGISFLMGMNIDLPIKGH